MKRYDLVVVGGGPAGLMAARTAGGYGLSVALLERKKEVCKITRACGMMIVSLSGPYIGERVILNTTQGRLCFPRYGFSIPYDGLYRNFYSWQLFSYSGAMIQLGDYRLNRSEGERGRVSATYDKSTLLHCLLQEAEANSVEVFPGKTVIDARHTRGGAQVITSDGAIFEGRYVIGADGRVSRIARVLGINKEREFYGTVISYGAYMADLDLPADDIFYTIFMAEETPMRFYIIPKATDKRVYAISIATMDPHTDYMGALKRFMRESTYASWFRHARKVEDRGAVGNMISPMRDPVRGNFVFVGDSIWFQEAEMTGAVISAWKAVSAIVQALKEGPEALQEYVRWWQGVYCNRYDFTQMVRGAAMNAFLSTDDIHFLFSHIEEPLTSCLDPYEVRNILGGAIANIAPVIQKERPELIAKLMRIRTTPLSKLIGNNIRVGFPNA
jgi:flavin-dependent dehydrogenase